MDYILLVASAIGGVVGFLLTYLFAASKLRFKDEQILNLHQERDEFDIQLSEIQSRYETLREENLGIQTLLSGMEVERDMLKGQLRELSGVQEKYAQLLSQNSGLQVRLEEEQRQNAEKLALLKGAEEEMKLQFSKLANDIFEQRSKVHAEQNRLQLDTILKPFKEQVDAFGKKIEDNYITDTKERHLLQDQIVQLRSLNERLSDDAKNLTNALKGENKTQGNWGEIVLERILEESGLREGMEYETQGSFKGEEGNTLRPDVIIHLPQEKDIVIDSKVSLVAYERFMSAEDPVEKEAALKKIGRASCRERV